MPLFCTLKNQYAGTNTPSADRFVNRGYPLMFEKDNKHMFYLDPEDATKTVQKFYGAPLSVTHEAEIYDPNVVPSTRYEDLGNDISPLSPDIKYEVGAGTVGFGSSFRTITKLEVNDHQIRVQTNRIQIPYETQLSLGTQELIPIKTLNHKDKFNIITGLTVKSHKITPTYTQCILPTETTLTVTSSAISNDYPSNGGLFRIMYSINAVSNHTFNWNYDYVYLPSFDLKLLNPSGTEINYSNNTVCYVGEPTLDFGYLQKSSTSSTGTWRSIKKIKFIGANYCVSSNCLSIDVNTVQNHAANHTFSVSNGNVTLNNTDNYGESSSSFNIAAGNGISITGSGTTLTITNSKPDVNHNTDTKCTSAANHYTPSGTAHNGNLVKGITYDSKGHITNVVRTTSVDDICVVSALPSWAGNAAYANTLFLVTGGGVTEPTPEPTPAPVTQYSVSFTLPTGVSSVNINGTNYTSSPVKFNAGTNITWTFNTSSTDYSISSGKTGSTQLTSNYTITKPTVSRKYHLMICNRACSNCELYSSSNVVIGNSSGNITTVTFNYNAYDGYNGPYGKYWEKDVYIDTNYSNVVVKSLYIAAKPASSAGYNKTFYCVYYVSGTSTISSAGSCNVGMSGDCFDISGKSIPHNNYMWQLYISESSNNITP